MQPVKNQQTFSSPLNLKATLWRRKAYHLASFSISWSLLWFLKLDVVDVGIDVCGLVWRISLVRVSVLQAKQSRGLLSHSTRILVHLVCISTFLDAGSIEMRPCDTDNSNNHYLLDRMRGSPLCAFPSWLVYLSVLETTHSSCPSPMHKAESVPPKVLGIWICHLYHTVLMREVLEPAKSQRVNENPIFWRESD